MNEKQVDIQINFDSLLKQGFAVIDVRFRDYAITKETFKYVIINVERERDDFYQNMLKSYLGKNIEGNKIFDLWTNILKHKLQMSEKLGRDISIKVAGLYFVETVE